MIQIDFTRPRIYIYDDDVWLVDDLDAPRLSDDGVTVRCNGRSVTLTKTDGGFYEGMDGRLVYRGVRGESSSYVMISGNWVDNGCEGPFFLVIPKNGHA